MGSLRAYTTKVRNLSLGAGCLFGFARCLFLDLCASICITDAKSSFLWSTQSLLHRWLPAGSARSATKCLASWLESTTDAA